MKTINLLLLPTLWSAIAFAQDLRPRQFDSLAVDQKRSYAQAGVNYISDVVFAGRKDSVAVPYVVPSIGYFHKSGFFMQSSFSFLIASHRQGLDLVTLSGGYLKSKPKYAWGLIATNFLFSDSSYNVQSGMSGYVNLFGGYDIGGVVTVFGDAMLSFGDFSDFFTGLELSHSFYAFSNQLTISPSVYGIMGTQYYYDQHFASRRIGGGGMGNGPGGSGGGYSTTQMVLNESSEFRLLAIELSLPINFQSGRFSAFISPVYVLPQSPSSFAINGIEVKETLTNSFYLSAGLMLRIGRE